MLRNDVPILAWLSKELLTTGCHMNSLWNHAWRARADGTATDAQRDMVQAQADGLADGRKTRVDAWAAVKAGTATDAQRDMVQAQADGLADGRKTRVDAWAAVAANTATKEQRALVKGQAKGLAEGTKARSAKVAAAAVAAGKRMMRCTGPNKTGTCSAIGPERQQHVIGPRDKRQHCGYYRLPID